MIAHRVAGGKWALRERGLGGSLQDIGQRIDLTHGAIPVIIEQSALDRAIGNGKTRPTRS